MPGRKRCQGALGSEAFHSLPSLRYKVNDLGIIYSVWLDPSVTEVDSVDHKALFDVHRKATAKVIKKAMRNEPTIEWLLENQDKVTHYFHDLGVKGKL
jgi:5,6,7,8-tetrahydromethanopterin hydro-lyase